MIALVEPQLAPLVAVSIASPVLQNWMTRRTRGIAYTGLNIATLKKLPVPLRLKSSKLMRSTSQTRKKQDSMRTSLKGSR
jgi:hypothetical protein